MLLGPGVATGSRTRVSIPSLLASSDAETTRWSTANRPPPLPPNGGGRSACPTRSHGTVGRDPRNDWLVR